MRNKGLALFGVFALILFSLSIVSANNFSLGIVNGLPSDVRVGETYSVKVRFGNTNSNYTNGVSVNFSGSDFALPNSAVVVVGQSLEFNLSLTVPSSQNVGSFSRTLNVGVYNASNKVEDLHVTFSSRVSDVSFCESEGTREVGDLDIRVFEITNNGEGEEDVWQLLDNIEIQVDVKNNNVDDSISNVVVELKIMRDGSDVTDEFELDDSIFDIGRIKSKDTESASFIIKEVPVGLEDGDYRVYVRAYSDSDEENQCVSKDAELNNYGSSDYYADIEISSEFDDGVIVRDASSSMSAVCGQKNVEYGFGVYNVGADKEDKVLVQLYNSELGIDEKVIIDNFKAGKKKDVTFFFDMSEELSKSYYYLDIITYWGYDSDGEESDLNAYDSNSNDDLDETYRVKLDVLSCSVLAPIITADLVSDEVMVGKDVVVNVKVSNPSNKEDDFVVSLNGYDSWAELVSVEPSTLKLGAGQSADVVIRFSPNEAGVNTFNVRVVSSDNNVAQDVSLSVSEKPGFFDFKNIGSIDLTYWVAGVLIVLILFLFILILAVAIRRRG